MNIHNVEPCHVQRGGNSSPLNGLLAVVHACFSQLGLLPANHLEIAKKSFCVVVLRRSFPVLQNWSELLTYSWPRLQIDTVLQVPGGMDVAPLMLLWTMRAALLSFDWGATFWRPQMRMTGGVLPGVGAVAPEGEDPQFEHAKEQELLHDQTDLGSGNNHISCMAALQVSFLHSHRKTSIAEVVDLWVGFRKTRCYNDLVNTSLLQGRSLPRSCLSCSPSLQSTAAQS